MRIGIVVPQGWTGEYDGWDAKRAWERTVWIGQQAESLGFESVWAFDHFETEPVPNDELTFESFTTLTALAVLTGRVRLGHIVTCAGYRNPALATKMISTMDVIAEGRMELGLGAGWKADEWVAYGYEFPPVAERMRQLQDALEIASRLLGPGRATYEGSTAQVHEAINVPKGLQQPRIPIIVGGNGREVTWRLAARYADELNLDSLPIEDLVESMLVIAQRCEEVDRDPSTLTVSMHAWWEHLEQGNPTEMLAAYREAGIGRVMALIREAVTDDEALPRFREQALAAGAAFVPAMSVSDR